MIKHVLLLQFPNADDARVAKSKLESLVGVVPAIRSLWVGLSVSLNGAPSDNTHNLVLITEHDDLEGLTAYQLHPAHVAVSGWIKTHISNRSVVDAAVPASE